MCKTSLHFFYQKYDFDSDDEWEWCEEYIYPESSTDYETVNFMMDFCEGQTCVKNLVVVSFDRVTAFFTANHFEKKTDDLISRQAAINNLAGIAKRCARSDPQMALMGRCIYMIENMSSIQPEQKTGRWSKQMLFDDGYGGKKVGYICSACKEYVPNKGNYCLNCGAKMDRKEDDG